MASFISSLLPSSLPPLQNPKPFISDPILYSQFVSPNPLSRFKLSTKLRRIQTPRSPVVAAQSNLFKVIQTALKIGKDGIEAGTNLVPDLVPRPIARICVTGVATIVSLVVLRSFLSTAFFVLAMMGFIYFVFIALNKDDGPSGGGGSEASTEDPLEEAKRIMEKYK
eukprot:TRINITY_DN23208_c0_g1_i1.p1 TRINITY_DN23208_c0_g1~~TRINITY_DN23208_c0_g1_i1.p1  ORF type:complete len:167 (-),score=23.58 TRINITY_DN23208_c0_g1_i1:409-909(-)